MQTLWCCLKKAFNESASGGPAFIKLPPSPFLKKPKSFVGNSCKINSPRLTHLVKFAKFAEEAGEEECHSIPYLRVLSHCNLISTFITSQQFFKRASFAMIIWKPNIIDIYPRLQARFSKALLPVIPATWHKNLIQSSQHDEHK